MSTLQGFLQVNRAHFTCNKPIVRTVYISDVANKLDTRHLHDYIGDKTPYYYREVQNIVRSFEDGYFLSAIKETLSRLPNSSSFQDSHFGEIVAAIFAEEVLGLKMIYSKLSLLTSENANAYKMDLVLYDPSTDPLEFVLGEVKSSPKISIHGIPVNHDNSCFSSIFDSMNKYAENDLAFDLQAVKDRIALLPKDESERIRKALLPYTHRIIKYVGFAVIDISTKNDDEISVLVTRKNKKIFDVDLVCIENLPYVASSVYEKLERVRQACLS